MKTVYVITWVQCDNSGHGLVGVYLHESLANHIVEILELHCDSKIFKVEKCQLSETEEK